MSNEWCRQFMVSDEANKQLQKETQRLKELLKRQIFICPELTDPYLSGEAAWDEFCKTNNIV